MVKKHVIAFACGMRNLCWHSFNAGQAGKVNPMWEFSYRFPGNKLSASLPPGAEAPRNYSVPLPRVFTLNNLLRDLDYVEPRSKYVTEGGVRVYAFDREPPGGREGEKQTVIAVWRHDVRDARGRNMALTADKPLTVRDAFGMKHDLVPDSAGRVFIPANDNPRIINVDGRLDRVSFGRGPISVEAPPTANAAGPFAVKVALANRQDRVLEGTVAVEAGVDWRATPVAAAVNVPGRTAATLSFKLSPSGEPSPGKHRFLIHFKDKSGNLVGYDEVYVRSGQ